MIYNDILNNKQKCCMTWKTFLDLFKEDYSLFIFDGINWRFKGTDIPIILHYSDFLIPNGNVVFINESGLLNFGKI